MLLGGGLPKTSRESLWYRWRIRSKEEVVDVCNYWFFLTSSCLNEFFSLHIEVSPPCTSNIVLSLVIVSWRATCFTIPLSGYCLYWCIPSAQCFRTQVIQKIREELILLLICSGEEVVHVCYHWFCLTSFCLDGFISLDCEVKCLQKQQRIIPILVYDTVVYKPDFI